MKRYYPELLPKRVNNVFMRNKTQAPNPAFHNPQSTGQPFSEHRLGEKGENCSKSRRVSHFLLFRSHNTYNRRTCLLQIPHRQGNLKHWDYPFNQIQKVIPMSALLLPQEEVIKLILKLICDDTISLCSWPNCGLIAMVDGYSQWQFQFVITS